jgi:hypothetical protein
MIRKMRIQTHLLLNYLISPLKQVDCKEKEIRSDFRRIFHSKTSITGRKTLSD